MTLLQAFLIGLWHFIANGNVLTASFGFYSVARPLFTGLVVGLILGDPIQGMIIGASINLIFMGWIEAGGARAGDPFIAGTLGTALAISSGATVPQSILLASLLAVVANYAQVTWMSVNSFWVPGFDKAARENNKSKLFFWTIVPGQILYYIVFCIPITLASYYGPEVVANVLNSLPQWVLNGIAVCGGVLPAIGIAMNMQHLVNKSTVWFYLLGFLLIVYFGMDMIIVTLLGIIIVAPKIFQKSLN
ncbi:MAG: PTS mannose/fructose/sorbose/N-acetylgalactosamine transporter subunit IIC [Anaerolineaceae bacterium]|jgi:mannose/fructose/N-acetylgalactosamine-specific phosphotransferase system component IIC